MLEISSQAIDIGIVARDANAMLSFYRDLLGLEQESIVEMPGGGIMNRLRAGDSIIKIIVFNPTPPGNAVPGGIRTASGLRYLTIHISNLDAATHTIEAAGHTVVVGCRTLRQGVAISIVQDPDGNWLELVEYSSHLN